MFSKHVADLYLLRVSLLYVSQAILFGVLADCWLSWACLRMVLGGHAPHKRKQKTVDL